jgi:hypothetical protein
MDPGIQGVTSTTWNKTTTTDAQLYTHSSSGIQTHDPNLRETEKKVHALDCATFVVLQM